MYDSKNISHLGLICGMYDELGIGGKINSLLKQDMTSRHLSIGDCVKALVLNGLGFTNRRLYLTGDFFSDKPIKKLFGYDLKSSQINDDVLGRALDRMYDFGLNDIYSEISSNIIDVLNLSIGRVTADTTSINVFGKKYKSQNSDIKLVESSDNKLKEIVEEAPSEMCEIEIVKGYSKNKRYDLNQVVLGLIIENKSGIPLLMKAASGNAGDTKEIESLVNDFTKKFNTEEGILFSFDSKGYTSDTISKYNDDGVFFVTRVPETIKEVKTIYENLNSNDLIELSNGYSYKEFESNYGDVKQCWVVINSEKRADSKVKTIEKSIVKGTKKEEVEFKKACKQEFSSKSECTRKLKSMKKSFKYYDLLNIDIVEKNKNLSKGRPTKDSCKRIFYVLEGELLESSVYSDFIKKKAGFFMLATNQLDKKLLPSEQILDEYKKQATVEFGFRFLKSNVFNVSKIFLKNPKRIEALLMVMVITLLVYSALEYRLRNALKENNKTVKNQIKKETNKPTMSLVFEFFRGIHILFISSESEEKIMVLNMTEQHKIVLDSLGESYWSYYKSD